MTHGCEVSGFGVAPETDDLVGFLIGDEEVAAIR